jgi:hypothetical protein
VEDLFNEGGNRRRLIHRRRAPPCSGDVEGLGDPMLPGRDAINYAPGAR